MQKTGFLERKVKLEKVQPMIMPPKTYIFMWRLWSPMAGRQWKRSCAIDACGKGKGFVTLECPRNLAGANIPGNRGVLLECVSNLAANELYGQDGRIKDVKETREAILKGIRHLAENTDRLAIVTNEVNCDVNDYSKETEEYRMLMGQVNQKIADMADMVTEVVYGIPVEIKRS